MIKRSPATARSPVLPLHRSATARWPRPPFQGCRAAAFSQGSREAWLRCFARRYQAWIVRWSGPKFSLWIPSNTGWLAGSLKRTFGPPMWELAEGGRPRVRQAEWGAPLRGSHRPDRYL